MQLLKSNVDETEQEWPHTKVVLIGPGRAGKTSLSLDIMGRPQRNTDSTRGINQFDVAVFRRIIDSNTSGKSRKQQWHEVQEKNDKSEFEFSMSLAYTSEMSKLKKTGGGGGGANTSRSVAASTRGDIISSGVAVKCVIEIDEELEEIKRLGHTNNNK